MKNIFILLALILLMNYCHAQEKIGEYESKAIGIWFEISESNIKNKIESYFKRELRELSDVCIYPPDTVGATLKCIGDEEFFINIVAMELHNKSGDVTGFAMSVTIEIGIYEDLYNGILKEYSNMTPENIQMIERNIFRSCALLKKNVWHVLQTGSLNDLKSACSDMVAEIDTELFEPNR